MFVYISLTLFTIVCFLWIRSTLLQPAQPATQQTEPLAPSKMTKTVVILGGSYGGLHVAHYLLKQKYPDVKVILITKVRVPSSLVLTLISY